MIHPRNWSTVQENLHGSASRLSSKRVASHLAALTALWLVETAWWTRKVMLPIRRAGKWIGRLACWPQIADTSGRLGASGHVDMCCGCLWTLSTLDFWWLNGRIPVSPSWSVELPCWEWKGRSPDEDLPSSWRWEAVGCSTRGMSRWWPALWPPSTARHPRPAGSLAGCFWSGSWCTDGWAEVFDGKWCPPRPWQCRWPDRCPADSSTVGQSPPGEPPPGPRQRLPAEGAKEVFLV